MRKQDDCQKWLDNMPSSRATGMKQRKRPRKISSLASWAGATLLVQANLLLTGLTPSLAQCPFGASGVTSADWQRTGTFPPGFLFGVATASHQVEGNDVMSDWAIFE